MMVLTMYRVGDIRRKNRKKLKRRIIALVIITGVCILSYLIVFKNGLFYSHEGIPDTIIAVDTLKDGLTTDVRKPATEQVKEKKEIVPRDTPVIPVYSDVVDEKSALEEPADKKTLVERKPPVKAKIDTAEGAEKQEAEPTEIGYKVISVAYFYNEPDEGTRRRAYINHWNNSYATLKPTDEKNGFVYVVFTNHLGQTSQGWLRKKDLREVPSVARK